MRLKLFFIYVFLITFFSILNKTLCQGQITLHPVDKQICNGNNTFFNIQTSGSSIYYIWQDSVSSWSNITSGSVYSNPNNDTLFLNNIPYSYNNRRIRCIVDTNYSSANDDTSYSAILTVYPSINGGTIGNNQTICYNTSPAAISFSTNPSGGGNSYSYQWQISSDGTNYANISGDTNATFTSGSLTSTSYFKVKVTSTKGCGEDFSNAVKITVLPNLNPGVIGDSSTICYNSSPSTLYFKTNPSGSNGNYNYKWQKASSYNGTYSDISGASSTTYNPGSLIADTYFRLKVTPTHPCSAKTTNPIGVKVWNNIVKATIGSDHSICYGTDPNAINISSQASGGGGAFSNQWQQSSSYSGTYSDISGQTANSYDDNSNLYNNAYYRVKSTSQYGCGPVYSDPLTVTVYSALNSGTIGSNQTICYNTAATSFSVNPSGGGNSYSYQWLISSDGTNYTNISGDTNATFTSGSLTSTSYFKVKVTSIKGCGEDFSNAVKITVLPDLNPGVIGDSSTICYNASPSTLYFKTNPSGSNGSYTYQWQKASSYNGTYSDISSAKSATYNPGSLIADTYFRLKVTPDYPCGAKTTNVVGVKVWPNVVKATIGSDHSICYGTDPNAISISSQASGGGGAFSNQWQKSSSYSGTYSDISGQTANSYDDNSNLYNNAYYRVKSTSQYGCGPVYSDPLTVTVFAPLNPGNILNNQTICYNSQPSTLAFDTFPAGEGNSYSFQWKNSINGASGWTNIGIDSNSFSPGNLNESTYYLCIVTSKLCGTFDTTNSLKITVYDQMKPGNIGNPQTICYNTIPNALTFTTSASGEDNNYNYQWEESNNGSSGWIAIGTNNNTYSPGNLISTKYYHCKVTSKSCNTIVTTNTVKITVNNQLNSGTIGNDQTICYNTIPGELIFTNPASGEDTNYNYIWEESNKSSSGWHTVGTNDIVYRPGNLDSTKFYRCKVTSNKCKTSEITNDVQIAVYKQLKSGTIGDSQTICFHTAPNKLTFKPPPSGEDNTFNYEWQKSNVTKAWNTVGTNADSYNPEILDSTIFYRCVVTSKECNTSDSTNSLGILVYPKLIPGKIYNSDHYLIDTICHGEVPLPIIEYLAPFGGNNIFNHYWEYSNDTSKNNWQILNGEVNETLNLKSHTTSTFYRLVDSSDYGCGCVITNPVHVRVDPLPKTINIRGKTIVCKNQQDVYYYIDSNDVYDKYLYNWEVEGGGIGSDPNKTFLYVNWSTDDVDGFIYLTQTIDSATRCSKRTAFNIDKNNYSSPGKSTVINKPGSNILICMDVGLNYQWGYENKMRESFSDPNDNLRYWQVPSSLSVDDTNYYFWVETSFDYPNPNNCSNRSYYKIPDYLSINSDPAIDSKFLLFPNPNEGDFNLLIDSEYTGIIEIQFYNVFGQLIKREVVEKNNHELIKSFSIGENARGLYMGVIKMPRESILFKLIVN